MIRVGLFVDTFFPMIDGVIHVVHNYAMRMKDEEFEVVVFCPSGGKKFDDSALPYPVVRCKSSKAPFFDYRLPLPKLDRKFRERLEKSELDLVHIHSPFAVGKAGVEYAERHGIPAVAFLHSQYRQDFYQKTHSKAMTDVLLKNAMKVFNACDEFYAVNPRVAEIFLEYGAKHLPLVQRNCADMTPVEDRAAACASVNEAYALPADVPVFLFVGRINALKNVFFLVDALTQLRDRNYRMIFVGDGQDMPALQRKVRAAGLSDRVVFTGTVSDKTALRALYARAKLFLFPSPYDTNSLVQLEAASQRVPTVFLEGTATASTVTDNVNGFLSKPTPEAYAERIGEILADEALYERVSEGAFRDLYVTWDATVREMKARYKEIVEKKKRENR